jgi:hypothetical protein
MILKYISFVNNFSLEFFLALNMMEEGLINHPLVGFGELGRKVNELRNLFKKIEESEVYAHS